MERLKKIPQWGWIVLAAVAALLIVLWLYRFPWTGFGEDVWYKSDALEYRRYKALWDWLGLLVIPVMLAIGGYWFTHRREEDARKLQDDRLREEALHGYIDRMGELVLDKKLASISTVQVPANTDQGVENGSLKRI